MANGHENIPLGSLQFIAPDDDINGSTDYQPIPDRVPTPVCPESEPECTAGIYRITQVTSPTQRRNPALVSMYA